MEGRNGTASPAEAPRESKLRMRAQSTETRQRTASNTTISLKSEGRDHPLVRRGSEVTNFIRCNSEAYPGSCKSSRCLGVQLEEMDDEKGNGGMERG